MKEKRDPVKFEISGCISLNGDVYIPRKGLVLFCQRFSYLFGKDFAKVFEKADANKLAKKDE